ncbi:polysaccharide biosynthesis/export family protein [Vineibacter terrae]|nr:polysaccharide biosynthesis/export family protein [Vineibacter terrae]HEX2890288.1 polysaccharide biosynthesis/export family protein [Vineibacter terrae]
MANVRIVKSIPRRGLVAAMAVVAAGAAGMTTARAQVSDTTPRGGQPPGATIDRSSDYKLGGGDRMRIIVYGQPNLTGEYVLDGSGALSFPLIGQVQAMGMTPSQLEHAIVSRLHPDYLRNPSVSVEVMTRRPFYIVGEVRNPGSYPYVSGMTVINAIALAGGFTYRARESSFYIKRNDRNGQSGRIDANQETPVQPGDVIMVRERYF